MQPVRPTMRPQVGRCGSGPASDPLWSTLTVEPIKNVIEARQFGENLLSPDLQLRQALNGILPWAARLPTGPPAMSWLAHVPFLCARAVTAIRAVSAPAEVYAQRFNGIPAECMANCANP